MKLRHLAKWNESRRELAHRYHELFAEAKDSMVVPLEAAWTKGVYHLYVVRVKIAKHCRRIWRKRASEPEFTIQFRCISKRLTNT